ncbi:MAG: succinate dehydrogenase assembly factor 2 [Zoogloeaceae bacterium]|jgi:succinate dehydrogenase flavin-adding protein (antitoxin of CptAB toxin-antitoxin module)|nr:succinate dehydrogenase assembly factor 2 [Zoogloeaceae bacterium]
MRNGAALTEGAVISRLRWRCTRRAMLEMDLLLGRFLEEEFPALSLEEQKIFMELADREDAQLWPWVSGKEECADIRLFPVIQRLRRYGEKRGARADPASVSPSPARQP